MDRLSVCKLDKQGQGSAGICSNVVHGVTEICYFHYSFAVQYTEETKEIQRAMIRLY